jgi:hypothetical protein
MPATNQFTILCPAHLLSTDIRVKMCRTIALLGVLYGCETFSLTLREEHRQTTLKKSVLQNKFRPKLEDATGDSENCMMRSPIICTPHQMLLG